MKIRFIVNPRSGAAQRASDQVRAFAQQHAATIVTTERPRHASELSAQAVHDGCDLIVAVGGDGTMNEIASALVSTPATLGLVPCGSGDGLGRHLGIHGSTAHALAILREGRPRLIDSGLANGHPFFTAAGIGFEADVAERFNHLTKRGFFRYLQTSAALFLKYEPQEFAIEHDGRQVLRRAFTLVVGNSNQYGNNARFAPEARVDDGLLNLMTVARVSLLNGPFLLAALLRGTLKPSANVLMLTGARFVVTRPSPGPLHTDGEIHQAGTRVEFIIRPQCLRILAPSPATAA